MGTTGKWSGASRNNPRCYNTSRSSTRDYSRSSELVNQPRQIGGALAKRRIRTLQGASDVAGLIHELGVSIEYLDVQTRVCENPGSGSEAPQWLPV